MCTAYEVKVMLVKKFCNYIWSKSKGYPTVILSPALHLFVWIRPQKITQQTLNWNENGLIM